MTSKQKAAVKYNIKQKLLKGEISQAEHDTLVKKLETLAALGATLQETNKALWMYKKDPGTKATVKAEDKLEKEIKKVYGAASKEMTGKLKGLQKVFQAKLPEMADKLHNGEITKADYDKWIQTQILQKDIVKQKIDQLSGVMLEANKVALGMVNGAQVGVFAENANYQAYQITQDTGLNLMFSVYDEKTAGKLLKDQPELLPRKEVNGKKDKAWNRKKIAGAVLQAVIQGESIPNLARRIAEKTAETNMTAMIRYARTAMTSAQNAGRMEMLHQADGMGIKAKKVWLATLDHRTRDTHAKLDGTAVGIDEKFPNGLMFPGDPNGPPGECYNCRCTLIYEYEGYPGDPTLDQRRDNETGQLIQDMDYTEWKAAKEGSKLNALNYAKQQLAEAQKAVIKAKVDEGKAYEGIWKDPVTLADYADKKASIQGKKDYYVSEIQKYKDAQAKGESWATDAKIKDLQKRQKLLAEFEKKGKLIEKRDAALKAVQDVYQQIGIGKTAAAPAMMQTAQKQAKKAASPAGGGTAAKAAQKPAKLSLGSAMGMRTPFSPDAYTPERKKNALWSSSKSEVDSYMRPRTGEVWQRTTAAERDAIFEYTQSYSKYNEPLRGIEYGTNKYKGVGNTDLNTTRNNGKRLNAMTDIIDKCSYDNDMWLQRGVRYGGMDKFFNVSDSLLQNGSEKDLQNALLGTTPTEYGFMSMGSAKGQGFSSQPIIMNIYCPSGTKMMYAEPFSAFGNGSGSSWDGKKDQKTFGSEFETILQQGTQFRVTKVERKNRGTIYIDLEVIGQDNQQRYR